MTTGLIDCDYYSTDEYNYTHFVDLSSIETAQSDDYYARVPVYIIGARYGNVILSTSNTPNRDTDFVYEFGNLFVYFAGGQLSRVVYSITFLLPSHDSNSVKSISELSHFVGIILILVFLFSFPFLFAFNFSSTRKKIAFGSVENTKTRIRKRIDNYQLDLIDTPNILSELRPLKLLIEISKRTLEH